MISIITFPKVAPYGYSSRRIGPGNSKIDYDIRQMFHSIVVKLRTT